MSDEHKIQRTVRLTPEQDKYITSFLCVEDHGFAFGVRHCIQRCIEQDEQDYQDYLGEEAARKERSDAREHSAVAFGVPPVPFTGGL